MKHYYLLALSMLSVFGAWAQGHDAKLVIPSGHTSGITSVDISADERYFLTASLDNTLKIWGQDGREIRTLAEHKYNVLAAVFSPKSVSDPAGGRYVLSGSSDYTAILWDLKEDKSLIIKGHNGYVTSVAFSPDGKELLTGCKDDTARIFDIKGQLLQKFPHTMDVNSVAFSPNGQYILTSCSDNNAMVWERSGNLKLTVKGHKKAVLSAVFSMSGDSLLTGSDDGTAILWKSNGEKIRDFQHSNPIQRVGISYAEGKMAIVAGAADGTVRIWNLSDTAPLTFKIFDRDIHGLKISADGQYILLGSYASLEAKLIQFDGKVDLRLRGYTNAITAMAISPDGVSLLVAQADSTAKIWNLSSQKVANYPFSGRLESVAFSPKTAMDTMGGRFVLTGCEDHISRIQDPSGFELVDFSEANRAIFSPDGNFVLTGNSDGTTKLWDINSQAFITLKHNERRITALAFSPIEGEKRFAIGSYDGAVIVWDSAGAAPRTFSLGIMAAINALAFSPDGQSIVIGSGGGFTEIRDLSGNLQYEYPNRKRGVQNVRSVVFAPAENNITHASRYILRASGNNAERWDINTSDVVLFSGHTADVNAVAFGENGNTVFTGSKDGTVKIWEAATGKEIATLIAIGDEEWAVTTPSGLFDASPHAMKLMRFSTGLDIIDLEQLKARYYEPGLLLKLLGFSQEPIRNVSLMGTLSLYPEIEANITGTQLNISLTPRDGGIGKLSLYVNGKEIVENINPNKQTQLAIDLKAYSKFYQPVSNTLSLRAFNSDNWLKSPAYQLTYPPVSMSRGGGANTSSEPSPFSSSQKIELYIIVVGTSNYSGEKLDLTFPDLDATAMAQALESTGRRLFGDRVHLKLFTTKDGTPAAEVSSKTNIEAAYREFAKQAKPSDVLVVYFSGHGITYGEAEKSQFYYLTKDIASPDLNDPDIRKNYTISSEDLTAWLTAIPAKKQVMILDACNSGKVVEAFSGIGARELNASQIRAFDRMKDRTGMFILTGAAADKVSFEASQYGQGLLTYSLLQGMSGLALYRTNMVDVMTLFQYARDEVPELAKSIRQVQIPVLSFPDGGNSFEIGIKDDSVKILLAPVKPVFIRSSFQDQNEFRDVLGLNQAISDQFKVITLRGAQAQLIYVDVNEYEQAYYTQGRYSVNGNVVTVTAHLFKGKIDKGAFSATGKKDDMPGLVNNILNEVMKLL